MRLKGSVAALVPAAGSGRRLAGKIPKPFIRVCGKPLLAHTLQNLSDAYPFSEIVVAVEQRWKKKARRLALAYGLPGIKIVAGGRTRAQSVRRALDAVTLTHEWILIHDAARPLVDGRLVRRVLEAAAKSGAALCGLPSSATVKKIDVKRARVLSTQDRRTLYLAQTPQVFRRSLLERRYRVLGKRALHRTDEAALFDGTSVNVRMVEGSAKNLKITTADDLKLLRFYLGRT